MAKKRKRRVRCESCRKLFDRDKIFYGPDPYWQEIHDDETLRGLCEECIQESANDI